MVAYGRTRNPGKVDLLSLSGDLLTEQLIDAPLVLWGGPNSGGADLSANGRSGSVGSSVGTGPAISGYSSWSFPGTASNAGAITASDASWQSAHSGASGAMTWEALVVPTTLSGTQGLWCKGVSNSWEFFLWLGSSGSVGLRIWQLSGTDCVAALSDPGTVSAGSPAHVVATWSRAAPLVRIYVNGVSVASNSSPVGTSGNGTGSLVFGYRGDNSTAPFLGNASHLALYDSALSADRVLQHAIAAGLA